MYKVSNMRPYQKALIIALLVSPFIIPASCKTVSRDSKTKAVGPGNGGVDRIVDQGRGQYRIVFTEDPVLRTSSDTTLKWHVVSGWSRETVDCSTITNPAERATLLVEPNEVSTVVQANPGDFTDCESDPQADDEGRKVSLNCQQTGNWDGSRLIEACLFDSKGDVIASGRGTPQKVTALQSTAPADAAALAVAAHTDDVLNYGQVCAERLGPLPRDWSCLDGPIIPITKDGVETPFGQHKLDDKCDKTIYLGLGDQGQCVPYSRLLRLYTKKDVETVVICRRYKIGDNAAGGTVRSHISPDVPLAQDVAIVQHNIKTGETCFFQALSGFQPGKRDLPVARIPPPNEKKIPDDIIAKYKNLPENQRPVAAADFWIKPSAPGTNADSRSGFQCIKCHDSDPFMHSPYVDQVNFDFKFQPVAAELFGSPRTRDNLVNPGLGAHPFEGRTDKMVPCNPGAKGELKDGNVPGQLCVFNKVEGVNEAKGKYSLVHKVHQRTFPNTWNVIPKTSSGGLDDTCTKCHRVGSINTCSSWVPDSVGGGGVASNRQRTQYGAGFPFSHWMPVTDPEEFLASGPKCLPDPNNPQQSKNCPSSNLTSWRQKYEDGAKRLDRCCQLARDSLNKDPNLKPAFAAECKAFPISTPPPGTGGIIGSFVLEGQAGPIGASGTEARVVPLTGSVRPGKVNHIVAKLSLTHKSPGDIRVSLQHNGQTVEIFNGDKDLLRPNKAITDFTLSIDSADFEDVFRPLMNQSADGAWSLLVNDDGAAHGGNLDKISLEVGLN